MFKKYPFIKQKESKDCGVESLLMIFKYYNGYVNPIKLEELTKTTKNGVTAYHLVETLKYYGFKASGLKCSIEDLRNQNFPAICHVTLNKTYNHYMVIYEVNDKYVLVADPSDRIKKMSLKEFGNIYNNILIVMSPEKELPKYFEENSKFRFIINIIKSYKLMFVKLLYFSILITLFSILNSFYLKYIIDNLENKNIIIFIFLLFLHFSVLNIIYSYLRNKAIVFVSHNIDYDITTLTFEQIIKLPYRYFSSRTTGDIISRITDLHILKDSISKVIVIVFIDLILIISSTICLYFINLKLFIISIIVLFFYVIVFIGYHKLIKNKIDLCQKEKADVTSYMYETISNYENINGLNIYSNIINIFKNKYGNYLNKLFDIDNVCNMQNLLKSILNDISFILIIFLGALEINKGNMTVGSLMTFNSLLVYFLGPIKEIIDLDNNLSSSSNALERVIEVYYNEKDNGIINTKPKGSIKLNNLSFSYDDNKNILKNISLEIEQNEKVLIIGSSGSGKSTILKLLKKYYKVNRNQIFIDDIDINDYLKKTLDESICYISQNESLYTDTLYNNIDLYRSISKEKIYEIAKICELDFIDDKLGYNMLIEENGFNLSGGQRQRLILSRSLLNDFNILLIDEATNQIDISLERKIFKRMFDKFKNRTIIAVSHRLENMDLFDKVIKINNSKIEVITRNE